MRPAELGLGGYFSNPIDDPVDIIRHAYINGVTFFDTAPAYKSEHYFGSALKHAPRKTYIISTKTKAKTAKELAEGFFESLENLKTKSIDIYFGHDYINDLETWENSQEALQKMIEYRKRGLISKIGVSGSSTAAAIKAIDMRQIDYIMVPQSIVFRIFDEVINYASHMGVKVITMKNFGSGILLGGPNDNPFKEIVTMEDIISFSAWYKGVNAIIPAYRSIKQFDETFVAYLKSKELTTKQQVEIQTKILAYLGDDFCRFCNACRPCDIYGWSMSQPGILKSMLYDNKFNTPMNESYKNYKLNYSSCDSCDNLCSQRCPFGIDIKSELKNVHQYFNMKYGGDINGE